MAREICKTVNTRLATVKNKEGKPLDNKREIKKDGTNTLKSCTVDDTVLEQMLDIMEKEVEVAIKNLRRRKAPGEDDSSRRELLSGNVAQAV